MTEFKRDSVNESFAHLTGQLEDAAAIAAQGQGARSLEEARVRCNTLLGAIDLISDCLQQMKRQLK